VVVKYVSLSCRQNVYLISRFDQVRDEHRQDYDPGRGGWGAQAQRLEIERRREVEERYADAQDGPGAVAGGGGEWKEVEGAPIPNRLKRGRSPDDDDGELRMVWNPALYLGTPY
jgi:nuclear cap-binding protein subunit 2